MPTGGEDQSLETQFTHQALAAIGLCTDELGAGTLRLAPGVAGNAQEGGVFADFGADLALETGPAMHEQGIHLSLHVAGLDRQP